MTTLRFTGNLPFGLPWWTGLLAAVAVAVLSWMAYRREKYDIPPGLRWLLPLLRSAAFFLGVLILAGPVLHHRKTIGELGRVKIYLDASESMTMQDRHMSTGRKLLIAERLGWITPGKLDASLLSAADQIAQIGSQLSIAASATESEADADNGDRPDAEGDTPTEGAADSPPFVSAKLKAAAGNAHTSLAAIRDHVPEALQSDFQSAILDPLAAAESHESSDPAPLMAQFVEIAAACRTLESAIRDEFETSVRILIDAGDESIEAALTLFDETSRWRRAELALNEAGDNVIRMLREKHNVEVFFLSGEDAVLQNQSDTVTDSKYDESQYEADVSDTTVSQEFKGVTDLSSGVTASQRGAAAAEPQTSQPGDQQTAIVLITDGQHNSGPSPIQTARILGSQGVSWFCVSVGASDEAQDLAVLDLDYPDTVFQKDRVRGQMIIRDRMKPGRPFVAEVRYDDEVLWQQQLITTGSAERRVEFEFAIDELVDRIGSQFASQVKQHTLPLQFEASIAPLAEESETSNNQQTIRLAAITESYRLLILDGRSRWETRYLRNVFERDDQWSVTTIIAGPGTDQPELPRGEDDGEFPSKRDQLFEYDLVIFGEVNADLFQEHELEWLSEFVEVRGGGIVFIDGQRGRLADLSGNTLGTLLPVEWTSEKISSRPTALKLSRRGASQPFLKLKPDSQQNEAFWTQLPPPRNMVVVSPLPGSEVLVEAIENEQTRPVMVTRTFGAGRVIYLATDETWRWRYKTADEWHQRIWNQIAKYTMPRPFAVSDEFVSVDTGSVSYNYGDAVDIRVRLTDLDGKPTSEATADAIVWKDGRIVSTISLDADADVPGIYRGRTGGLPQGEYEVSVRASGYSEAALQARSRFEVLAPESGEMSATAANELLLRQLAETSSGQFLREEDLAMLPDLLSPLSSGRVVESDTLLWQSYWWFAAIILLLTVEWALRKRAGML